MSVCIWEACWFLIVILIGNSLIYSSYFAYFLFVFNLFGFNSSPLGAKRSIKIQLIHNTSLSSETRKLSGSERACPGDTLLFSNGLPSDNCSTILPMHSDPNDFSFASIFHEKSTSNLFNSGHYCGYFLGFIFSRKARFTGGCCVGEQRQWTRSISLY